MKKNETETLKNRPVVDPSTGKVEWISRSMCVAVFVFTTDMFGNSYVLANKRGRGCPNNVGKWNAPCGYLDYGESLREAAQREVFEETGVKVPIKKLKLSKIEDNKFGDGKENVTVVYKVDDESLFETILSTEHSEKNEVSEVRWIPVECAGQFDWAFGHLEIINEMVYQRWILS